VSFLTRLFGREDPFLALLEASVEEGRSGLKALQAVLQRTPSAVPLEQILRSHDRAPAISEEIQELLCDGTSAPLDREEIEVLARVLDGISHGIRKFGTHYQLCARRVQGVSFRPQIERLEQAVNTVGQMVTGLRSPRLAPTKRLHDTLQTIEAEADRLFITLVMDLQKRHQEPLTTLMLRDLYELLERVIDRCRTAGNIILRLVLKHT
jgi:uncharacterized protein